MASINYDEISYAEIITFLKVAQTLNMSMAARALHVSQPAVSKRIANLEKTYGIILFVRTGNGLQMTPAGKIFYQEALVSLEHLKSVFTKASAVQAVPVRTLRLAYDGFFDLPLLYEIIERFSAESPRARIQIHQWYGEDCADLFNGRADILLCPDSFSASVAADVCLEPVSAFQFAILVAEGNPLYEADQLGVQDLLGVPLTVAHMNSDSPYVLNLNRMFLKYGFSPAIDHLATRESLCFEILTRKGAGIATPRFWRKMDARTADFFDRHIRVFPIEGEQYPVSFVWKNDTADLDILRFIRIFRSVVEAEGNKEILYNSYN